MDINSITTAKTPQVTTVTEASPPKAQPQPKQQQQQQQQQLKTVVARPQSGDNKDSITINAPIPEKTVQIRDMSEVSNTAALKVKVTEQKLAAAVDLVDKMKAVLGGVIVKNFPPFPAECSERKQLLMSYLSLQKELIQLTVPPPPPPVYEQVKLHWQDIFTNNSPNQSKLPAISDSTMSASDLNAAISELSKISDGINSVRETVKQTLIGN